MERRISTFLEEKGFDIKRRRKGQTIVDTLKDFFESENCINVNDAEDTINLNFEVFMLKEPNEIPMDIELRPRPPPNVESQISNESQGSQRLKEERYSFLKQLANEEALRPLRSHPYITAFLDLHFSIRKHSRVLTMRAVTRLATIFLLTKLESTMPGYLKNHPEDMKIFAVPLVILVVGLDLVFYIAMSRKAGAWMVKKGLVEKDWWQSGLLEFQSSNKSMWEKTSDWLKNAAYFIGYLICIPYSVVYRSILALTSVGPEYFIFKGILDGVMISYSLLLLSTAFAEMMTAKKWKNSRLITLLATFSFLVVGILSAAHESTKELRHECPWIQKLICIVVLVTLFQLLNDIGLCLPYNLEKYLDMFYEVARRYLKILTCFSPFLLAFVSVFQGNSISV